MSGVLSPPVPIPFGLEVVAVVAGAVAGSTRAIRERLAISGVVGLAVALGLGGGIIRDTLLQKQTPVAFTDPWFLPIALAASIPALLMAPIVRRLNWAVVTVDALAIGLYSILGADRALLFDLPPVGAALIGVLAGTGGSILADVIVGVPPDLFRPGVLLGVASAAGTVVFVAGTELTGDRALWFVVGVALITALRLLGIFRGWAVGPAQRLAVRSEEQLHRIVGRRERQPGDRRPSRTHLPRRDDP